MKIKEINITPIAIQDPPLLNAAGLHAPYALRIILELITDNNISGISEIPGGKNILETLINIQNVIIGMDPFQISNLKIKLQEHLKADDKEQRGLQSWDQRKFVHIFSAMEIACLDIIGKEINRPIVDLIGGAIRERVPFSGYLFFKYKGAGGESGFNISADKAGWESARQEEALTPESVVKQAKAMREEYGFQSLKLKAGILDPELEVNTILALRDYFGPDIPIRIDPNAVWSLETALKYAKQLSGVIEYLEDPVRSQETMSLLKKQINIPLATNMCTTSFEDIPKSIQLGSEDIILFDHHFWGGFTSSMQLAKICDVFGRSISMHSNSHLGISLAAMVHLGAALPKIDYAFDTHYPWQCEEVIQGGHFHFEDGFVELPKGPGLGIEIDKKKLEKLHKNYKTCGILTRNDEIEMQKINSDWKFKPVRY